MHWQQRAGAAGERICVMSIHSDIAAFSMAKKRLPWRPSDIIALRMLYPNNDNETIGRSLVRRRTWSAVQNMAVKLGLKKSPSFLNGPKCRFQKGIVPWNLGVTGYMGANRTSFRKGNRPQTWRPVGSERVTDGVLLRKVKDTRRRSDWKPVKDIIWEAKRGPIPKGRFVRLKNPKRPLTLRNLELVDRAANMRRNTYHRYPKEIARLIQLRGALNRQINRRQREEQDRRPSQSSVRGNREGEGRRHATR